MIPSSSDDWIYFHHRNPQARLRLFCFPHAGGGIASFHSWSQDLPLAVEVCSINLPGRDRRIRETPFSRITPLVETLATAIRPHLDLPFVFFGHSMGGLIAFELARQLRSQGKPQPRHLFISGYRAPHLPDLHPPIHQLPEPEFLTELRNINGTPEEVLRTPELLGLILPLLRADFALCETYSYQAEEPMDYPISVFGGLEDEEMSPQQLAAWRIHTSSSFNLQMFPGDHFFLLSSKAQVLKNLSSQLHNLLKPIL